MPHTNPIARDPNPMMMTEQQQNPSLARPEDFKVGRADGPLGHGQDRNDVEAAKRSMEKLNTGSIRAAGNVNRANQPSYQQAARDVKAEQDEA